MVTRSRRTRARRCFTKPVIAVPRPLPRARPRLVHKRSDRLLRAGIIAAVHHQRTRGLTRPIGVCLRVGMCFYAFLVSGRREMLNTVSDMWDIRHVSDISLITKMENRAKGGYEWDRFGRCGHDVGGVFASKLGIMSRPTSTNRLARTQLAFCRFDSNTFVRPR
ncbi:hypothetical protein BDW22DRAFT_1210273 [Trametopsis cervina]|nr:hypothetical protein BDW22DRAFT_1210273 [Trametopsis cervina]